jgi:Ca-activated chloride channel homolog
MPRSLANPWRKHFRFADSSRRCLPRRHSRRRRAIFASLGALTLASALLFAQQQPIFRADVRLVHVLATVRNKAGQLVGSLKQEDFEISDNGAKQEVAVFERQTDQPLSIALLIDVSGSTAIDLKFEIESASKFIHALLTSGNPGDAIALYTFDDTVTLEQNFSHNLAVLQDKLKKIHGQAGTSLYDAIYLAARDGLESRSGRKAMVIVSDGGNTTSSKDSHQALEAAQIADAVVYPVVIMPIMNSAGRNTGGEHSLTFIAQQTGGSPSFPMLGAQLDRAFNDIITELRTEYLLGFYPHNVPLTKDRYHKLTVRVKQPDLQVSARGGYYGESESLSASSVQDGGVSVEPQAIRKKR